MRHRLPHSLLPLALGLLLVPPLSAECPNPTVRSIEPGDTVAVAPSDAGCPGQRFAIEVPDGVLRLDARLRGSTTASGNADLLVAEGGTVAADTPEYLSASPGVNEMVSVANPAAGDWAILVRPGSAFTGVSLRVELTAEETYVAPGIRPRGLADPDASLPRFRFFTLEVPPGSEMLSVRTSGGSGDVDLFVRPGHLPTETSFLAASKKAGNDEGVDIPTPAAGVWKVGILRVAPYEGVDLDVEIDAGGACEADAATLCLLGGRFRVRVDWLNQRDGTTGAGSAVRDTDRTGAFYFFRRDNTELFVKMLDGRPVNGSFWVFWSGLTDLEYHLEVYDTATDTQRTFVNPPGSLAGGVSLDAFPAPP